MVAIWAGTRRCLRNDAVPVRPDVRSDDARGRSLELGALVGSAFRFGEHLYGIAARWSFIGAAAATDRGMSRFYVHCFSVLCYGQCLHGRRSDIAVEDRVQVFEDIGADIEKVPFVFDGNQDLLSAVVHGHPEGLDQ